MRDFEQDDRVIVNETLPNLVGETGTVTNPDYMDFVMVNLDNDELRNNYIGCFAPKELEKLP